MIPTRFGVVLLLLSSLQLAPVDKPEDKPMWKDCSELKPVPKASDGSLGAVCVDRDDKRYEVVLRGRKCEEILNVKSRDDYQHFVCTEELLIRREVARDK